MLSKGDCVESGYSEVMIAQFILNCRLLKESVNVGWAHVVFNFIHENRMRIGWPKPFFDINMNIVAAFS